ncbi:MAG: Rieske 2Fe-2S domain-containing protein [Acidobacteriota bacterium]
MSDKVEPTVEDEKIVKEGSAEKPPVTEKATTEKATAEKTAKPVIEKAATEKAAAEKSVTEKPAVEKSTEKPAAEKAGTEKTAEKPAAEKPVVEKPAAAKAAVEKAAAAKPAAKPAAAAATATAKRTAAAVESKPVEEHLITRRRIVWTSVVAFVSTISLMCLRFFLPRTLFEPSTVFRIGYPSDFGIGVDTKFQSQYRIWVVRNAERLFVIYARCTHLGCTPDWKGGENKFKCPCHGSGFDNEGINFEGPAPRPLDRAKVELDAEGQIVVDINKLYQWPKGAPTQFDDAGSYLKV